MLSDETTILSPRIGALLADMAAEWATLDRCITAFDKEFAAFAKNDDRARRLASIPGIGPLSASALVAAVGEARSFARGPACCMEDWKAKKTRSSADIYATGTEFGRPRSSIRLRTSTAMAISVAWASAVWKRSIGPMTCLKRPIWPSTKALRL